MRRMRAMLVPIALLALLVLISSQSPNIEAIAAFDFIWDVVVGIALGASIAALPSLSAFNGIEDKRLSFLWACGFCSLIIIFAQYMTTVVGLRTEGFDFIPPTSARMRVVEGAFLGYCSLVAGREKI